MSTNPPAPGVYRGLVFNDNDPEGFGRITALVPQLFGNDTTTTDWAWPVYPMGAYGVPPAGEPVWISFIGADIDYPVWLGTWKPNATPSPFDPAGAAVSKLPWGTNTNWVPYNAIWSSSGTNPTIGNGTLEAWYTMLAPHTCFVQYFVLAGSTTTFGTGSYFISLPFPGVSFGQGVLVWQGSTSYIGASVMDVFSTSNIQPFANTAAGVITWLGASQFTASGQNFGGNLIYQV